MSEEENIDGMPVFIDTSGQANREQWNMMWTRIHDLEKRFQHNQEWIGDLEEKVDLIYDHNDWWHRQKAPTENE